MANQAKTQEFFMGDLDIRVSSDLTKAGKLGPADTIGLLQDSKVAMTTNQAKLKAGFPQKTYATAVTSREMTVSGNLNEYSISNLAMIYGDNEALAAAISNTEASTTIATAGIVGDTDLTVADTTGFTADDTIYVYDKFAPDNVMVMEVASVDAGNSKISVSLPMPRETTTDFQVVKVVSIKLGSEDNVPPLTIQIVGVMPLDNTPFVYDIWKGTISGSAEVASSTQNFGAPDAVTKQIIKKFPMGRLAKKFSAAGC